MSPWTPADAIWAWMWGTVMAMMVPVLAFWIGARATIDWLHKMGKV